MHNGIPVGNPPIGLPHLAIGAPAADASPPGTPVPGSPVAGPAAPLVAPGAPARLTRAQQRAKWHDQLQRRVDAHVVFQPASISDGQPAGVPALPPAGAAVVAVALPPQELAMLLPEIYQHIAAKIDEPKDAIRWRLASKVTHRAGIDAVEHVIVDEPVALLDALRNCPMLRKVTLVGAAFPPDALYQLAQLDRVPTIALALRFPDAEPGSRAGNTHIKRASNDDLQVVGVNRGTADNLWPERQRMLAALHTHGLRGPETADDRAVFDAQCQDNPARRHLAF